MVTLAAIGATDNPAAKLEEAFRCIERERMADLPFLNRALQVEAINFSLIDERWLGVLVTPWSMSLICLPGDQRGRQVAPERGRIFLTFPSGEYAFLCADESGVGNYLSCSLFSSMQSFPDQITARNAALAALVALQQPVNSGGHVSGEPANVGRRGFLGARLKS